MTRPLGPHHTHLPRGCFCGLTTQRVHLRSIWCPHATSGQPERGYFVDNGGKRMLLWSWEAKPPPHAPADLSFTIMRGIPWDSLGLLDACFLWDSLGRWVWWGPRGCVMFTLPRAYCPGHPPTHRARRRPHVPPFRAGVHPPPAENTCQLQNFLQFGEKRF